jgi:CheY-like chemotaxis protein
MKKILLVDADEKLLGKLGKRLGKAGFEVKTASEGSGALESALLDKPDLVITNYHLPVFDGERLRAFIKHNPTTTHIPFIFLIDTDRSQDEALASAGGDSVLIKPFRWQEIRDRIGELLDRAREEIPKPAGSGVEGSLKEVSLVDLLQIFGLNRRTGTLVLLHENEEGKIYLVDGSVVSTVLGETNGEKALYRILRWHDGTFRYHPGEANITRNISRSMDALLMEGMRQLDEWDSIYKLMPPPDTILELAKPREELPQNMRPVTQEIILLMEFYNTLEEIVEKATHTDYDICRSILGLIQKGIVVPVADSRSPVRKQVPLITSEEAISIHRTLRPVQSDYDGSHWGKVLVFSPDVDLIRLFLTVVTNVKEFKLSRDNFSNQEVLSASFGTLGTLEISANAYLQIFLLPSTLESSPLWRAFSEGAVGAFYLQNGETSEGDDTLSLVRWFLENELEKPLLVRQIKGSQTHMDDGANMFKELFGLIQTRHTNSEEAQA